MNTCFKAVIFDLDGTLLDTIDDLAASMNYALAAHGFPTHERSHHERAIGNGLRKYAERCIPKDNICDSFLDEFVKTVATHYRKNSTVKTVMYDGIRELLEFLKEENIFINILSNKRDDFVKELNDYYFKDFNFKCAYGEIPGGPKKPDPAMAQKIADECGVSASEVLFIGDSIYDVQTGKNAGMKTIAVTWGYQPKSLLKDEYPDFMANKPQDIINYIKNLF